MSKKSRLERLLTNASTMTIDMKYFVGLILFFSLGQTYAQDEGPRHVYPFGERPDLNWASSLGGEKILFEANPIVRYAFYDNIVRNFDSNAPWGVSAFIEARPQLRMYVQQSVPVKMPSYRILLGGNYLYRLPSKHQIGFSLLSGHYSNGQSGCPYCDDLPDEADSCYLQYYSFTDTTNLGALLNRTNGEFSTNMTELIVGFRLNGFGEDDSKPNQILSFKAGWTIFHDKFLGVLPFGGYKDDDTSAFADFDIDIYRRHRIQLGLEYSRMFNNQSTFVAGLDYRNMIGAKYQINPNRLVASVRWYHKCDFGYFMKFIYGHDDYNIRFLDSGFQFRVGISWNTNPHIKIKGADN